MTLIEGIGDEVTEFFVAITAIAIVYFAWHSTNIRQQWNIRTVYLLDRRHIHVTRNNHRLSNHTESATISEGIQTTEEASNVEEVPPEEVVQNTGNNNDRNKPPEEQQGTSSEPDSQESSPLTSEEEEQSEILEAMDGDTYELLSRRVAFYETHGEALLFDDISDITMNEPNINIDSNDGTIMEHNYAELPQDTSSVYATATPPTNTSSSNSTSDSNITVKLKYINDDLKAVDGRLQELLGDFKRRHFEAELSSNKLIRLIFNGQVLQRDTDTLQSCGMFDNCVVHCLVHQQRVPPPDATTNSNNVVNRNGSNNNNNQRDWDLGNLLLATVSFSLGSAWYLRYQYPQLFTITATMGLVIITGIFSVISIGMYFPDTPETAQTATPQRPMAGAHTH